MFVNEDQDEITGRGQYASAGAIALAQRTDDSEVCRDEGSKTDVLNLRSTTVIYFSSAPFLAKTIRPKSYPYDLSSADFS